MMKRLAFFAAVLAALTVIAWTESRPKRAPVIVKTNPNLFGGWTTH